MKKNPTEPFKQAFRKKIKEEPIHSINDAELWRKVLKEVKPEPGRILKTEYPLYAIAASILLFISLGLGIFLYNYDAKDYTVSLHNKLEKTSSPLTNDFTEEKLNTISGKNEISLKESLPERKSSNNKSGTSSLSYFKNAEVVQVDKNVLKYNLTDGSIVTLNEGSIIKIDDSFKDQRNLKLEGGEAYFEVQPDKNKPFTVYFSDYWLVVVGTKFNVRNISTEKIKEITVTEGIVRVFDNNNKEGIEVKHGEQLRLSKGTEPVLQNVETLNYISWKTGNLDFKRARLEEVAVLLSRKFEEEIILANQIKNCKFTGDLSGLSIDEALKIISSSTSLKVEKSNHKLYISGSGCD
jgi:transmembrane sensor